MYNVVYNICYKPSYITWIYDYITGYVAFFTLIFWYTCIRLTCVYPDFPLDLTRFFQGKHLIQFLADKMHHFRNFVLRNCIFATEEVYIEFQAQAYGSCSKP